jgi:hypothetical protein
MNTKLVHQISKSFQGKTTEELTKILDEHDISQWSEEAFVAIAQLLSRRNIEKVYVRDLEKQGDMESLINIVSKPDDVTYTENDRKEAALALKRINVEEAVNQLLKIVINKKISTDSIISVLRALGEIASPRSVNQLVEMLKNSSDSLRIEIIHTLHKIDDSKAKEAIRMADCQYCHKEFLRGDGNNTLCPYCFRMDSIGGWLLFFVVSALLSAIFSLYNGYEILGQNLPNEYYKMFGYEQLIFAVLLLLGIFLLFFKISIARLYIMILILLFPIVFVWTYSTFQESLLPLLDTKESSKYLSEFLGLQYDINNLSPADRILEIREGMGRQIGSIFGIPILFSIIWFIYFWRSKRVKIICRTK